MTARIEQLYSEKGDTWPKILRYNYEKYGENRRAMRHKRYGIWQPSTWKDYYINVKYFALGLLSLGFEPGDKLLIIGDNAPQWYYAELAAQANLGASVGVYSESIPSEIKYIAENSETRFAIVQDQEQVDKLLQIKEELPLLKKVVYWNYKGLAHYDDPILTGYRQVLQSGEKYDEKYPGLFERNVETGKADDVCAVVYTSGTTGVAPKGAVHTYRTMRSSVDDLLRLGPWDESDNVAPHLPPAWITEQWYGIGCHLLSANILNFAEAPETQQRDTRETRPSIVSYEARLWESRAATVQARILGADAIQRFAFGLLMPVGYRVADLKLHKRKPDLFLRILYALADAVLFRPLRNSLGLSNARICYSTGAILSPEAFRFYHALNLPVKSLYGTTEGGFLAGPQEGDIHADTVGPVHRGAEVRITDAGEITYRQPGMFTGYYRDPEKTAQALKEGWFHSGDSGFFREDGHLIFVDRVNDVVVMQNGDRLSPQLVESRLRFSPYIKDAWVMTGPGRAYASAIIVMNYDHVSRWAGQKKVTCTTFEELSQRPEVCDLIGQDIHRINDTLPPGCRVRKYVILQKEFDPDEGDLTRTRKLRRTVLKQRYCNLVDAIYGDKPGVSMEARITHQDGRIGPIQTTLGIKTVEGADS